MNRKGLLFILTLSLIPASLSFGQTGLGAAASQAEITAQGYDYFSSQGYNLGIKVQGEALQVYMSAPTTGWLAVGFNPSRRMRDANITIGYAKDGELTIRDDYGIADTMHGPDTARGGSDDVTLLAGGEAAGRTWFEFQIPLDSGDSMDRALERGKTYPVIWAFGPNNRDDFRTVHGRRGSFRITIP
ncbi:DOMON domain-containing protein [Spirochaeta lutea]|uniref:DOMON domain-containing protein n=1 Tax=Spirochaeta lutea TaxID=1480694 RepID=UPI00068FE628|nr:DOMON domain-containing protein [Spirochaeta lutea]